MTKEQLLDKIREAINDKYSRKDGSLEYYHILKDIKIQPNQIKALYGNAKNPGINSILDICAVLGLDMNINDSNSDNPKLTEELVTVWLAVDGNGGEYLYKHKPMKHELSYEWVPVTGGIYRAIGAGTINLITGKTITFKDEPIEIQTIVINS